MASQEARRLVRAIIVIVAFFAFLQFARTDAYDQLVRAVTNKLFIEPIQRNDTPAPTPSS